MTHLSWARGPNRVVLLRLGLGLVGFALFLAGCKTAGDLTRDTRDSTRLVYGLRAAAVFAAAVAAVGDDFEIVAQDQRLGEIRLQRESYMNGIWLCHGEVMAVFLSPDGDSRTRVEIVEKKVSPFQAVGCPAAPPPTWSGSMRFWASSVRPDQKRSPEGDQWETIILFRVRRALESAVTP
jgi:hypothetical protein